MFKLINQFPTLFEVVTERERGRVRAPSGTKRKKPDDASASRPNPSVIHFGQSSIPILLQGGLPQSAFAHSTPKPHGHLLTANDISDAIVGREAEVKLFLFRLFRLF